MQENKNLVRLQKYIADCGVASRRKAEEMILEGKVTINGVQITELGTKVDVKKDNVKVEDKLIKPVKEKVYIMLNKPTGHVTTVRDQFDRPTVIDLIDVEERVFPIGRLDYDTSGLLLLTNDGELTNKVTHPKFEVSKTYIAKVEGNITEEKLDKLRVGVKIEDYTTSPAVVEIINSNEKNSTVKISIHEGKNRQVRNMFDAIGHKVIRLKRISIGELELGTLREGKWRFLDEDEVNYLKTF
jgi:23S rRNA pseudouridine2605 synthase